MSDPRGTAERYLSATSSSNLRLSSEGGCDADKLLAAAYATAGDRRKSLALQVWRVRATGSLSGVHDIVDGLGGLLRDADRQARPHGRLRNQSRSDGLSEHQAKLVAIQVLRWWKSPTCRHCAGLGHPTYPNAPILDLTRECPHCHGSGQIPLERQVRTEHAESARWLVGQMESLSAVVFDDMARLLRSQMIL